MKTGFFYRLFNAMHLAVAYVLLPTIVIMVCAEVAARYVFRFPLTWSEEVVTSALLLTSVLSIPLGIVQGLHVRVETVYELWSSTMQHLADHLGRLCGAVFLGLLAFGSGRETLGMIKRGETSEFASIPQWPLGLAVALMALTSCLYLLLGLFRSPSKKSEAGESTQVLT